MSYEDKLDWCNLNRCRYPGAGTPKSNKLANRDNINCGRDITYNQEVKFKNNPYYFSRPLT